MEFQSDVFGHHFCDDEEAALVIELADDAAGVATKVLSDDKWMAGDWGHAFNNMKR